MICRACTTTRSKHTRFWTLDRSLTHSFFHHLTIKKRLFSLRGISVQQGIQAQITASTYMMRSKKQKVGGNTKVSCLLLALMFHKCARSGIRSIPNVNVSPWMSIYLEASFLHSFHKRDSTCITCSSLLLLQVQLFPPFAWSDPSNNPPSENLLRLCFVPPSIQVREVD